MVAVRNKKTMDSSISSVISSMVDFIQENTVQAVLSQIETVLVLALVPVTILLVWINAKEIITGKK